MARHKARLAAPAEMAAKWQQAMMNPQTAQNYTNGINSTTVNPMQLAASQQAQQKYLMNTAAVVNNGSFARILNAVPIEVWRGGATQVGAQRLATGAQKALRKVRNHFETWGPIYQQAHDAAHALPKGGLANAMARVQAALNVMMQHGKRAGAGGGLRMPPA